ncbi:restriction endonuclease subunit S [uncultured Corynebacterium sp.]|uniref:restriction endonuclease subunit S n=1 Tax=uncultured Corynebacterium sp. TaxID=159447 RepID=UPI0025CE0FBD|nr:restriction endonuclease subunit S [uncultured Corynebacterium sp.]
MTRDGWKNTTLGDICEVIRRGKQPKYVEHGLAVVNQKCVRNDRVLQTEHLRFTDIEQVSVPEGLYLRNGDVLVNSTGTGTVGRSALIEGLDDDLTLDSHVTLLRPKSELVLGDLFADILMKEQDLVKVATGGTNQVELSARAIKALPVQLPPIEEQREIVNLVRTVDNLIQAGDREISSAGQMREGILRSFIQQMAEQFEMKPLQEIVDFHDNKRKPVKKADRVPGPYPYYGASGVADYVDGFLFEGLHLLIAEDGENIRSRKLPIAFLADGKFWVNNHAHIVKADTDATTQYVALAVEYSDISAYITGSSRPKITKTACQAIKVPFPSLEEQEKIVEKMQTLDSYLESAQHAQEALKQVRKDVLHALLSGDKDVREVAEMFTTDHAVA